MNCRETQKAELAGKTKLTAVTIGHGRRRLQAFVMLEHDEQGKARLKPGQLDQALDRLGVLRGQTFTSG